MMIRFGSSNRSSASARAASIALRCPGSPVSTSVGPCVASRMTAGLSWRDWPFMSIVSASIYTSSLSFISGLLKWQLTRMQEVLDRLERQMIHHILGVVSVLDDQIRPDQEFGWHAVEVAPSLRRQRKALR